MACANFALMKVVLNLFGEDNMEASTFKEYNAGQESCIHQILKLFEGPAGKQWYDGYEAVSQKIHALQSAQNAILDGAENHLVCAALLHDIGHLLDLNGRVKFQENSDAQHELVGANWLGQWFPPSVTEPIRWHVAAKRYLCASEPSYYESLSKVSQQSLALQGGIMSLEECIAFEKMPSSPDAILLRRWDDRAKDPEKTQQDFNEYIAYIYPFIQISSSL